MRNLVKFEFQFRCTLISLFYKKPSTHNKMVIPMSVQKQSPSVLPSANSSVELAKTNIIAPLVFKPQVLAKRETAHHKAAFYTCMFFLGPALWTHVDPMFCGWSWWCYNGKKYSFNWIRTIAMPKWVGLLGCVRDLMEHCENLLTKNTIFINILHSHAMNISMGSANYMNHNARKKHVTIPK